MPPKAAGRRLMFLSCNSSLASGTDQTQLLGSHRLWFMVGAVKQGHLQHYLLNIWAHLAGSLSAGKLEEVIITFLKEIPPAARIHILIPEKISGTEIILVWAALRS